MLFITGQDKTPVEISNGGGVIYRKDMDTTNDQADILIIQQMLMSAKEKPAGITVLSDDTDVFVLNLHQYSENDLQLPVAMESPVQKRIVVDVRQTVHMHKDIISEILK